MTLYKILSSLSMDLHRIAMARKRGSDKVADRFILEAKRRIAEIDSTMASAELADALSQCRQLLSSINSKSDPSGILFYSVYFQNEALKIKR